MKGREKRSSSQSFTPQLATMPMDGPGRSQELHLDLPCGWQLPKHKSYHLLPPRTRCQEVGLETGQPGWKTLNYELRPFLNTEAVKWLLYGPNHPKTTCTWLDLRYPHLLVHHWAGVPIPLWIPAACFCTLPGSSRRLISWVSVTHMEFLAPSFGLFWSGCIGNESAISISLLNK